MREERICNSSFSKRWALSRGSPNPNLSRVNHSFHTKEVRQQSPTSSNAFSPQRLKRIRKLFSKEFRSERELSAICAAVRVAKRNERIQCVSIAASRGRLKPAGFAVGVITCNGFFERFPIALFRLRFGRKHPRKLPLGSRPIARLHRFANTLTVNETIAPDRAMALRCFASAAGLRTLRRVPSPEVQVCHSHSAQFRHRAKSDI